MAINKGPRSSITPADIQAVSPALANYIQTAIDAAWNRPQLSARDRSIVTVATLIARIQTIEMPHYFTKALDSDVTPAELSEIVTHLAFYSGWANAFQAVDELQGIFADRGVGPDQLPAAKPDFLPLNEEAEARRATQVQANFGETSQGVVEKHHQPSLPRSLASACPRGRAIAASSTVAALVASGQTAQIPYHLNRAMDNGLTREQASEVLTHMAFLLRLADCLFGSAPSSKKSSPDATNSSRPHIPHRRKQWNYGSLETVVWKCRRSASAAWA